MARAVAVMWVPGPPMQTGIMEVSGEGTRLPNPKVDHEAKAGEIVQGAGSEFI